MPTVPERPAPVKPTAIRSTVTPTMMMGSARLILMSQLSRYEVCRGFIDADRRLNHSPHAHACRQHELQKDSQHADSDGQNAPEQAHPRGRNRIGIDAVRGRNIVLRPGGDFAVIEGLGLAPSYEGEKRFVIRIMNKNELQPVAVRVF